MQSFKVNIIKNYKFGGLINLENLFKFVLRQELKVLFFKNVLDLLNICENLFIFLLLHLNFSFKFVPVNCDLLLGSLALSISKEKPNKDYTTKEK